MDEMRTMSRSTRAKTALYTKKITPITPVTISCISVRIQFLLLHPSLTYGLVEDGSKDKQEYDIKEIDSGDRYVEGVGLLVHPRA